MIQKSTSPVWDTIIIGGGLTGLAAARRLSVSSRMSPSILILDKGRGLGGRLSNRRLAGAVLDHGAQSIHFKASELPSFFQPYLKIWQETGAITQWFEQDKTVHYRGAPAMTAAAKSLMAAIQDHCGDRLSFLPGQRVIHIERDKKYWQLSVMDTKTQTVVPILGRSLIITMPIPQALSLLEDSALRLSDAAAQRLGQVSYEKCLVAMATLNEAASPVASKFPASGLKVFDQNHPVLKCAIHQQVKGVSSKSAVTIHATPDYSDAHWDMYQMDRTLMAEKLIDELKAALKVDFEVTEMASHGWRYAQPLTPLTDSFLTLFQKPQMLIAGDAFGQADYPSILRAVHSGEAAAQHQLDPQRSVTDKYASTPTLFG